MNMAPSTHISPPQTAFQPEKRILFSYTMTVAAPRWQGVGPGHEKARPVAKTDRACGLFVRLSARADRFEVVIGLL